MAPPFTREEFATPQGRKRAWRALMLGDHGVLRLLYDNSHEISPGHLWRTYQPSPAKLAKWQRRGIKTVINLRGDKLSGFYLLEEEACKALGLKLHNFQVFSREAPSPEILHGAQALFNEIEYPAIMHCKSGADRAGLMSVLYKFFVDKKPLDEALEQLTFKYGHVRQGKTGVIDFAFSKYIAYANETGKDLSSVDDFFEWVDTKYDYKETKSEFLGSWWGNILTEKILRRE